MTADAGEPSTSSTIRLSSGGRPGYAARAILDLSAGFLRPDPNVIRMFEGYMGASSSLIRKATLQAIAYRMWPEAKPLVESAAAHRRPEVHTADHVRNDHDRGIT